MADDTFGVVQSSVLFGAGDGDGAIDPGETVTTTVIITNNSNGVGAIAATGVQFAETLVGMTLVDQAGDDVNVSPLAFDDTYTTFGNTLLEVGTVSSGVPAFRVTNPSIDSVLDNDVEFFSDAAQAFTITQINGVDVAFGVAGASVTLANGTLTMHANGSFSFQPNPDLPARRVLPTRCAMRGSTIWLAMPTILPAPARSPSRSMGPRSGTSIILT